MAETWSEYERRVQGLSQHFPEVVNLLLAELGKTNWRSGEVETTTRVVGRNWFGLPKRRRVDRKFFEFSASIVERFRVYENGTVLSIPADTSDDYSPGFCPENAIRVEVDTTAAGRFVECVGRRFGIHP